LALVEAWLAAILTWAAVAIGGPADGDSTFTIERAQCDTPRLTAFEQRVCERE
jgi:hypothetical protein